MNTSLLDRLDAIGRSLAGHPDTLALIGLGSVGTETHRLDAWSDLDFFAIVARGRKSRFIEQLDWLAEAHPLAWHFQNTADGHKALMADGVFCEFAVFEPDELEHIAYAPGRVVWKREGVSDAIGRPRMKPPATTLPDEGWIVGEALTNLFVGLNRWHRGERLSAARFVQNYALDRLIELDALRTGALQSDPFNRERRLETRQPALAAELHLLAPGYASTPSAALAMLDALSRRGAVIDRTIEAEIRRLARA
jgi:hypothetical protein